MALWTFFGLRRGVATSAWPAAGGDDGQSGVLGLPRYAPELCQDHCQACAEACPTAAITIAADEQPGIALDYGRCIACQHCIEACPEGALHASGQWAYGVQKRDDLHWSAALGSPEAGTLRAEIEQSFRGSLHVRHVDAGSCNGCESELQALNNPFYNLHRLGIFFTPSPRAADLLLVTGSVTSALREVLLATYEAMPKPRRVMAIGTCAVSGGIAGGGYCTACGVDGTLPVDLYLPGCPPNPAAIIHALLVLLERTPQRVQGGRIDD